MFFEYTLLFSDIKEVELPYVFCIVGAKQNNRMLHVCVVFYIVMAVVGLNVHMGSS